MNRLIAFLFLSLCSWGQIVVIQGTDTISGSRTTINNNFSYLNTNKVQRFSGAGAPGVFASSIRGDLYFDTTPGTNNTYICFSSTSCSAVGVNNWVLLTPPAQNFSFSALTAGSNTAALTMGTGGVLSFSGTGVINANKLLGIDITTITGIVKMGAGVPSTAAAGTDYQAPLTTTNDTNVTGAVAGANLTLGWTGTLAAARLNANTPQSIVNDTNVTGAIAAQVLTLGWTGTLAKARIIGTAVYNDQANAYSAGLQDFGLVTLKIPTGAGLAPTANGQIAYDTTANQYKFGVNGVSQALALPSWAATGNDIYNSNAGNVGIGGAPGAYKLDVSNSGSTGTVRIYDQTAVTGKTLVDVQTGAGQSATTLIQRWKNNAGVVGAAVDGSGNFNAIAFIANTVGSVPKIDIETTTIGANFSSDSLIRWSNNANVFMGAADLGLARNGNGIIEVNNGTAGAIRDLKDRHSFCGGVAPTITTHFNTSGDSIAGGDECGAITVGNGMATNTGVITFGTAYSTAPVCTAENETTISQGVQAVSSTTTLTLNGFLFSTGAAQNFTNGVILKWQCKTY